MAKISVFSCPSCGASLSVDNEHDTLAKCQFCGNTVIVPEELRAQRPSANAGMATPAQVVSPGADMGLGGIMSQAGKLRELGNLVRAGNKAEAVQIYHQTFGGSLTDAQRAIDALAAGMPVQVNTASFGAPSGMQAGPASYTQAAYGEPAMVTQPRRGSMGCALAGLMFSLILGGAIVAIVVAAGMGSLGGLSSLLPDEVSELIPPEIAALVPAGYASQVMEFGGEGTGAGVFTDPRFIGVDGEGKIYVGEFQGGRIQVFEPDGTFITQWQVGGRDTILSGLAVTRQGDVYLSHDSLIFIYDGATGELLDEVLFDEGWGFRTVALGADGSLVATWYKNRDDIVRFDRNGSVDLHIQEAISGVSGDSELNIKAAVDGGGRIYALGTFNDAVFIYSPEGRFENRFGSAGDEPGQFRAPADLVVDNQSRIYVSDFKGIQVFDRDGRYLAVFDPPGHTFGLVFDDDNNLFVVGNDGMVRKYTINEP